MLCACYVMSYLSNYDERKKEEEEEEERRKKKELSS